MKLEDLNNIEKFFLRACKESPHLQYEGLDRCIMNTLAAYGLIRYAGNLRFEIAEDGEDLLTELEAQETSEEIPLSLQENRLDM
jgi:hypothetical protein